MPAPSPPTPPETDPGYLLLCDACCDKSGTAKEMIKTGGCTCDVCGWSCSCCGGDAAQFINRIPVRVIPGGGWDYLQWKNKQSLVPLDWAKVFRIGRSNAPEDEKQMNSS